MVFRRYECVYAAKRFFFIDENQNKRKIRNVSFYNNINRGEQRPIPVPDSKSFVAGRNADNIYNHTAFRWYGFVDAELNAIVDGSVCRIPGMDMAVTRYGCNRAAAMCSFA